MRIDPTTEEPTRELLGHAIRGEYDEFQRGLMGFANDEGLQQALLLAIAIAAYVAVDDNDGKRPTEDDLRELAESLAEIETRITITAEEAHAYLGKVVFGDQSLTDVFSEQDAARLPFIITGLLVAANTNTEAGQKWPEYLDAVEAALEATPDPT